MSVFPFISPENHITENSASSDMPTFREYAYDFNAGQLKLKNGVTYLVEGNDALKIWIYKALKTVRYSHTAYSRRYGWEGMSLTGQAIDSEILYSELRRFIIEALMVNPYIRELSNFTFSAEGSRVTVAFDCLTVYGTMAEQHQIERS